MKFALECRLKVTCFMPSVFCIVFAIRALLPLANKFKYYLS